MNVRRCRYSRDRTDIWCLPLLHSGLQVEQAECERSDGNRREVMTPETSGRMTSRNIAGGPQVMDDGL